MQSVVASVDEIQSLLLNVQKELQDQMLLVDSWRMQTLDGDELSSVKGTWEDVANSCQEGLMCTMCRDFLFLRVEDRTIADPVDWLQVNDDCMLKLPMPPSCIQLGFFKKNVKLPCINLCVSRRCFVWSEAAG